MNTCIDPNKIESWHLDAYVDGFAPSDVMAHIEDCPTCRQKVAAIRKENDRLKTSLFRYNCPDTDQLLNYQWGLLPVEESLRVSTHLIKCSYCLQESQQLSPPLLEKQPEQKAGYITSKLQNFRLHIAHLAPYQLSVVRHSEPELTVIRGQSPITQVYKIAELDMDIVLNHWLENDKTYFLQGQLLGIKPDQLVVFQVSLLQDNEQLITSNLTDAGVFKFPSVKSGNYHLCFYTEQVQFYIPDIFLS